MLAYSVRKFQSAGGLVTGSQRFEPAPLAFLRAAFAHAELVATRQPGEVVELREHAPDDVFGKLIIAD